MPRRAAAQLSKCRCDIHGCDDDIECSMERLRLNRVANATCKSIECLVKDLNGGTNLNSAIAKNDRYIYVAITIVALLVFLCALSRVLDAKGRDYENPYLSNRGLYIPAAQRMRPYV